MEFGDSFIQNQTKMSINPITLSQIKQNKAKECNNEKFDLNIDTMCTICLEDFKKGEKLSVTVC